MGVLPYGVKCTERGIEVSYGASRRHTTQISIFDDFLADLTLTSIESYVSRSIQAFDFASVTMGFATATGGGFKTPLVKGSPFITVVYSKTTPVISSELMYALWLHKLLLVIVY